MTNLSTTTLAAALPALDSLVELKRLRPSLWYEPHKDGQLQFHAAQRKIRALFPGNRFGKTRAGFTEAQWWATGTHPYRPTPKPPVMMWWMAAQYSQFQSLQEELIPQCFDSDVRWVEGNTYLWPNGSRMQVWSAYSEGTWRSVQGPNPHLIFCDEEPPLLLWRELRRRGAGANDTEYVVMATATEGVSWMETEIWRPWADHHIAQGLHPGDGGSAAGVNNHPLIWCWDHGGIENNPIMKASMIEDYKTQATRNEAERRVRLRGGFARFTGNPVFAYDGIERLMERAKAMDSKNKGTCGWVRTA